MSLKKVCCAAIGALLLIGSMALSAQALEKVGAGIAQQLESQKRVRVLVMFAIDEAKAVRGEASRAEQIVAVRQSLLAKAANEDLILRRAFIEVPGFAVEVTAAGLKALRDDPRVSRVDIDAGGEGHMLQGSPLSRVTDVFNRGLTGAGSKIAVIDSGIDLDHADFSGRIVAEQCFCSGVAGSVGCCPNALDSQSGSGAAQDDHGHGTNVAGVMAGGGAVAPRGGAPGADIVAVKVLDSTNSFCCSSDIVAALDWVRVNHPDVKVVNASLGTSTLFASACDANAPSLAAAVNNLTANGTMVFVSSGNQRSATSMGAPACVANSISVGAVYDSAQGNTNYAFFGCGDNNTAADLPTCFTNSNATIDLYAPGASATSSGNGGGQSTFTGTSQAAPLSAGCAATLRARVPNATAAEVEAALEASPTRVTDPKNGLNFPRLDCLDALARLAPVIFRNGFEAVAAKR